MVQKTKPKNRIPVLDRSNSEVPEENSGCQSTINDGSKDSCENNQEDYLGAQVYIQEIPESERVWVDVALDISTAITGYCVLDDNGDLINLGNIRLDSAKLKDSYDKADAVRFAIGRIVDSKRYCVRRIFVEESHMRFTPGQSSAKTLFALAGFNQVVCQMFYEHFKIKPTKVGVRTARSKLGIKIDTSDKSTTTKEKVLKIVMQMHPEFPWEGHIAKSGKSVGQLVYGSQNFDMADAWVICRGGQVTNSVSTTSKIKKTKRATK